MTIAADRLKALSGLAGVSAAAMLLAIGSGATAGACLVDYSGLATGTAAQHLLADVAVRPAPSISGGMLFRLPRYTPGKRPAPGPVEEDEALLFAVLH